MRKFLCFMGFLVFSSAYSLAQTAPKGIPAPPMTHILAIGHFTRPLTPDERSSIMPQEVPDTLRLILAGKIDQSWLRQDQTGAIFLMNVADVAEARSLLEKLPLGRAKLMEFELIPVGPLTPLALLLKDDTAGK